MTDLLLAVRSLSVASSRREGGPILRAVSLTVAPGEVHGVVGESGAGKSTVGRAVLGMLPRSMRVTAGAITLSGTELLTLGAARRRRLLGAHVALIPQDPLTALNPSRRVEAQLTDGMRMWQGASAREASRRALVMLDEVQMHDPPRVMRCYPHELSGGMRQRVLIAAAFMLRPKLVIADEPTTALDVTVQRQVLRLIRDLQTRHRTGAILITHDLGVVAQICDEVSLLYAGRVLEQRRTAELLGAPQHPYARALIRATPRYDRPDQGLQPIPEAVMAACRSEIVQFDRQSDRASHG